jgi:hypothetical protein
MKFSLDYCEHRFSHWPRASDSLIIPNGRIMDKNCLRPVCPSSARNPVFERNVNECLRDLSTIDMKESETLRANHLNLPKTQSPGGGQSP